MAAVAWVFADPKRYEAAQQAGSLSRFLGRDGRIAWLPGPGAKWTASRDAPVVPKESFRAWWRRNRGERA